MKTLNERVLDTFSELYRAYGYAKYKMSGFEEYDLYAANRDFLVSGQILTFTGADGRLMALKPDITMSIIKDAENEKGRVDKYFYSENVYRVPSGAHEFREIMQTGVECVGDIGDYDRAEAVLLACRSLSAVSEDYVVDISHMGLVSGVLEAAGFTDAERAVAVDALKSKNKGALASVSARLGGDMRTAVMGLVDVCGTLADSIEAVEARGMNLNEKTAAALLPAPPPPRINTDFPCGFIPAIFSDCINPSPSVLYPTPVAHTTVFTAPNVTASPSTPLRYSSTSRL